MPRWRSSDGFTLIEIMVVLALMGIIAAIAVPVTNSVVRSGKNDSAAVATMTALTSARARAVSERRNIILTFIDPNVIQISRQNLDAAGAVTGTTVVDTITLENGQGFRRFTGVSDTPDAFGGTGAVAITGVAPVMFTSDGTLVDNAGDVSNVTIFTGLTNQALSARAVTIFGASGVMRTWNWRGAKWME